MVKYNVLTGAEAISLRELVKGRHVARIHPGHAEKLRSLGFTAMKLGEVVVTEGGRKHASRFTGSHLTSFL